ncbi:glycosyltransferase [Halobacillus ihumii]|uniref:glycosyltransferase n=1 Tax=Halobacillus ihumii TaxID=2686092 RepID=UPI0013D02885|nr:glycosyltransferase [Halobacillus ihumii]
MRKFYFVMAYLHEVGGMMNAVYSRSRVFSSLNEENNILTFRYTNRASLFLKESSLKSEGILGQNTNILNMYKDYYAKIKGNHTFEYQEQIPNFYEVFTEVKEVKGRNALKCYMDGAYKCFVSYEHDNGALKFIDYVNLNSKKLCRKSYDIHGKLHLVQYYNDKNHKLAILEEFINENGKCYMKKIFQIENNKRTIQSIQWYSDEGVLFFSNETELRQFWIKELLKDNSNEHHFIIENRAQDNVILPIKDKQNFHKHIFMHTNHLKSPYKNLREVKFKTIEKYLDSIERIFFLTDEQKNDFDEIHNSSHKTYVVPHYFEPENCNEERNNKTILIMSRLSKEKRIDHIVKAFSLVKKRDSEVRLMICGSGTEEEYLKKLTVDLGIADSVIFKGYVKNIKSLYCRSTLSVITSEYEGFCLSILESLSYGCPVISYDFKYGPSYLIKHNYSGKLVKDGDIEELSNQIIEVIENRRLRKKMVKGAFKTQKRFSYDSHFKIWKKLLNTE